MVRHLPANSVAYEEQACQDRFAVQQDGAGAALAFVAAYLGAGEAQLLTQHFQQGVVRF